MKGYFKKNSSKFLVSSALILLLAVFLVGYPISDFYNRLFIPQPERVTELYFDNTTALPTVISPRVPAQFAFHTVNHESDPVTYSYIVTLATPGSPTQTLATGDFTLVDSQSTDIPVSFAIPTRGVRSLVTVQFIGRSETIHFWVNS